MAKKKFNYLVEVYGTDDKYTFCTRAEAFCFATGIHTMGGLFSIYRKCYRGIHVGEKDTIMVDRNCDEWLLILENENANPVLPMKRGEK